MPKFSDLKSTIWRYAKRPGPSTLNTNLLASWPMDDIGTGDRFDYGDNEFDFTNDGGANTGGEIGTRFEWYNHDYMYIDFADAGVLWGAATDPFSIAASFKVISWPVTSGLLTPIIGMTSFTSAKGWLLGVLPDTVSPARGVTFHTTTNGSDTLRIDGEIIGLNQWTHAVFRYDGADYYLQVDGVDATPVANATGFHRPTTLDLEVARYENSGSNKIYGDVIVRNVSMWDKWLSDDEVTEWYNSGAPLEIPFML